MIRFLERPYPSANSVLLTGPRPVLVDTGFGSDAPDLLAWLESHEVAPALIVNTHFHSDHVGGNHALQQRFGTPVATGAEEGESVNRRDPDACEAQWLRQPVEAYAVTRMLSDGDVIGTGDASWTVVATAGHTDGHLSLFCPGPGILILGDALHHADIGWLSPHRPESIEQTAATLDLLSALPAQSGYSGHGSAITDLPAALARARRRVDAWRRDRQRVGWHACKRIFAHDLMLHDGVAEAELLALLAERPWFVDHARLVFDTTPNDLMQPLVEEMLRADAAFWQDGKLRARANYRVPPPSWLRSPGQPADWAPVNRRRRP